MGYHWNRLDEHVFMACLLFTITQLGKLHLFKRDVSTVLGFVQSKIGIEKCDFFTNTQLSFAPVISD